jgi:hypothetical protein
MGEFWITPPHSYDNAFTTITKKHCSHKRIAHERNTLQMELHCSDMTTQYDFLYPHSTQLNYSHEDSLESSADARRYDFLCS